MRKHSFLYKNSLSIVFISFMLITLGAQAYTGWHVFNKEMADEGAKSVSFLAYLSTGHFMQATFENWESEFLQMGMYVILTVYLRQIGSSESKPLDEKEEIDKEPRASKDAPWPVRKKGLWLKLYSYSLSIAFFLLFIISFVLHAIGSLNDENLLNRIGGKPETNMMTYLGEARFWFESFQNWQSEFLSITSIVLLSIFLRQKGSPESKPVDAPHMETGK